MERVEGGFGITPEKHFHALRKMVGGLRGLAILDNDGRDRADTDNEGLKTVYWRRYEAENYFITPNVLCLYVANQYKDMEVFGKFSEETDEVLSSLILDRVFSGEEQDYKIWREAEPEAARLLWETKTEHYKLSDFAEEFFRRLGERLGHAMLLKKGDLHRLVSYVEPNSIPAEVDEKLDLLKEIFASARSHEETKGNE